nr:MAG TPA: hypothetical protein [Caudoviricetes sp.]
MFETERRQGIEGCTVIIANRRRIVKGGKHIV